MKILNIFALTLCLTSSFTYAIDLSADEKAEIQKNSFAKDVKWREEYTWPLVTMKAIIKGTPEQNMKEFTKFETHTSFIPDLMVSKVVKTISPTNFHVYCELKVPWPVSKSTYTTNNVVTVAEDGTQKLVWNRVDGKMIKATDGHIIFSNYEGKTLMEYQSQIIPNSSFAGMFKNKVPDDVEASVKAIIKHLAETIP